MKPENKVSHTPEWKEHNKPFIDQPIDAKMYGGDVRIKRFMIYEDDSIKVIRTEEPTFSNEQNNYIELLIKNGARLLHFPIGGYITREMAIENAKKTANLTAAAPDLLYAAEQIVEYLNAMYPDKAENCKKLLTDAIAKAKGGQQ